MPHDAVLVDDDGGAIRDPGLLEIETVEACDSALWVKISEQGQADSFQVPGGPVGVAVDTVHADAEDLGVGLSKIIEPRFQRGDLLASGSVGEIVIRGPNITSGYENNPEANATAFTSGWFRTGDQGVMDGEGYLTLTGRLKEIINRGGEKISPREVDEVLLDHPAVQQVVTFAVRHDKLGEDVAVALVLREEAEVTEGELRDFVAHRLAPFKVPRTVLFLDEIPKGPTGKLQRIGLAAKLGLEE